MLLLLLLLFDVDLELDNRTLISRRAFSKASRSGKANVYEDFVEPDAVVMTLSNDFGCDAGLT